MRKLSFVLSLCAFWSVAMAQVHIVFKLQNPPADPCFLSGNLNNWNPAHPEFRFPTSAELYINAAPGDVIQYKLTRGSWEKVECQADGADIGNRWLTVQHDTTIYLQVAGWKDESSKAIERKHTASPNVIILDSAFLIPQLNRFRTIRVYLPPDYYRPGRRYPVLYMQDGQNCFDEFTGSFGEWHVDETLDHFYDSCQRSMIVVAVDHGGAHRMQEYNPFDNETFGKGEGNQYVSFLVQTLKPFIDSSFRTMPAAEHTSIAGSSMGGLISMYAVLSQPETFGSAGVFSPAFWTSPGIQVYTIANRTNLAGKRVFFYAGGMESKTMVSDMQEMDSLLSVNHNAIRTMYVDEKAGHNEAAWSKWFPVFVQWMMRNSNQTKTGK